MERLLIRESTKAGQGHAKPQIAYIQAGAEAAGWRPYFCMLILREAGLRCARAVPDSGADLRFSTAHRGRAHL